MEDSKKKWWVLTAMCLFTVMINIDVTAVNIVIPTIAQEFHAKLTNMQWVINAYVLVTCMLTILGARLGDTYGYRKIFLIGVVFFVLSSIGAGLSVNESMIIAFRTVQGVGFGLAYPITIVLTLAAFPKEKQGYALSFIVGTMGISLAIGPPIAGVFVHFLNWRWIFFINVPIGIFIYILTKIYCDTKSAEEKKYIDYLGAVFLILGLLGVIYALNQVQNIGFSSLTFLLSFFIGLAFLVVLFFITRKQSYPIINFNFFKNRNFALYNVIRLIVQLVIIPVIFFMPLYLQNISGYSPLKSGLLLLYLTVVIAVISPFAGKWIDKIGDKTPNTISMALFAIGCGLFVFLKAIPQMSFLAIGLLCVGAATAVTFVTTVTGSVALLDTKDHGVGTGILFTVAFLGCALGISLMGTIISFFSESYISAYLADTNTNVTKDQLYTLKRVGQGIESFTSLSRRHQFVTLGKNAFMHGFRISMIIWGSLALIGVLLSLALKKAPKKSEDTTQPSA